MRNNTTNNAFFTSNPMYGHAYVPIQTMSKIYNPSEGLKQGTIFPELVSPYEPLQSVSENKYLRNYNEGGCLNGIRN